MEMILPKLQQFSDALESSIQLRRLRLPGVKKIFNRNNFRSERAQTHHDHSVMGGVPSQPVNSSFQVLLVPAEIDERDNLAGIVTNFFSRFATCVVYISIKISSKSRGRSYCNSQSISYLPLESNPKISCDIEEVLPD